MCIFDIKKSNSKFKKKKITKKNEAKNHRNKARIYFSKGEKIIEIRNIRGIKPKFVRMVSFFDERRRKRTY